MDKIKKCRGGVRAAFTRTYTAIGNELRKDIIQVAELRMLFALLKDRASELEEWNAKVINAMQDADDLEEDLLAQEMEGQDEYKLKYISIKHQVEPILNPQPTNPGNPPPPQQLNVTQGNQSFLENKRLKLPKIDPPKFSGELKEWLQFWGLFKTIHDDDSISKEQKFSYLVQAMVENSKASELINSFPPTAENYDKAITALTNRFGKKELLVEMYIRELLKLVLNNAINKNVKKPLSSTYDKLKTQLRALESLDVTTDMCAAMLYPLVESSLPEDLLRAWQRHSTTLVIPDAQTRLTKFMDFLEAEVESEQRIDMAVEGFGLTQAGLKENKDKTNKKSRNASGSRSVPTAAGLLAGEDQTSFVCIFCEESHASANCEKAKKMSLAERTEVAKAKNACYYCLKTNHSCKFCRLKEKCPWCKRKHVLLMCREVSIPPAIEKPKLTDHTLASLSTDPEVFLQTLKVRIVHGNKEKIVRAIIDSGSHRSYISSQVAEFLGYEVLQRRTMIHSLFGGTLTQPQEHNVYQIHIISVDGSYACNFSACQQDTICQNIPKIRRGPWLEELQQKSVSLSDTGPGQQAIGLLIGADVAAKLYTGEIFNLDCGVTAIGTKLGWTLMGKASADSVGSNSVLTTFSMFTQQADLSTLWKLDTLGIRDPVEKKTEAAHQREVQDQFLETLRLNAAGRYEVLLPWRENHPPLVDNRHSAERRLERTLHTLKKDDLLHDYQQVFDGWVKEGYIEQVPDNEIARTSYYLPHRPVVKEGSSTPLRPVFDASAHGKASPSLNECLETGPNLIELVPTLLTRFREKQVGVTADVRKAFLQISVAAEERDHLRFLWCEEGDPHRLIVYRHKRVVFGVSSSPFILGATINHHLSAAIQDTQSDEEKRILGLLKQSFYVDNCVISVDTNQEAQQFERVSTESMKAGGFDLRAWEYSDKNMSGRQSSVLGLRWHREEDTLSLANPVLGNPRPEIITKRIILSFTQRLFDPLGMISPVLICPKILLQQIWTQGLDWDSEVSENEATAFRYWIDQLNWLEAVRIPRWAFGVKHEKSSLSLHAFVDASRVAYAAVIYARLEMENKVEVVFVSAKARIAPKGTTTIPRLELLAATVGARLMSSTVSAVPDLHCKLYYWSDSSTVLAWIQRNKQWATFVWNRVQEIRQLTNAGDWSHVPGTVNPADLASRGCTAKQLVDSEWHHGPSWLKLPPEQWPSSTVGIDEAEISRELKKSSKKKKITSPTTTLMSDSSRVSASAKSFENVWYLHKFSDYPKILRLVAWILRFTKNCRANEQSRLKGALTVAEVDSAERLIFRSVQEECFDGERDARLSHMVIYKDELGLLRLKTPIAHRDDSTNFRCPVILDSRHPVVSKLIQDCHRTCLHGSTDTVLNKLRERVWILSSRRAVQSVVKGCVRCRRFNAKRLESVPIPLPENRVRDALAFEVSGVDLAGPLYLRDGSKAWVVLTTCAIYRAIHLELVSSLSTDSFLEALRRFIARRGRPAVLYSDNGTNFVGASNALGTLDWERIESHSTTARIEWRFNPPLAAWWGGWWERMVRMVKDLLRKSLGKASLTFEELSTVLCDCEAVINARPLTYLAEDPQQLLPLSPDMFLRELPNHGVIDLDELDARSLNQRVKYIQRLREELRARFRVEYLGQLKHHKFSKRLTHNVEVGDVVFVGNDNTKRLDWPLAQVVQLFPGKDGEVRVVKLKTANGFLVRPIQRLYPLEVSSSEALKMLEVSGTQSGDWSTVSPAAKPPPVVKGHTRRTVFQKIPKPGPNGPLIPETKEDTPVKTKAGRLVKKPQRLLD